MSAEESETPNPQDKGLAEAQLPGDTIRDFGYRDDIRSWGAVLAFIFGVVIMAITLWWAADIYKSPPDYFSKIADPRVQISLIVSKSLGVVASLSFGFAMLRLAKSLSVPLILEADMVRDRREHKDAALGDLGVGLGKIADAIKSLWKK